MAVPWTQIIRWAPQIIGLSQELLKRSRGLPAATTTVRAGEDGDLALRVASLEENERRQAELVERMAEQQAELARAVITLHRRQRWLIAACAVLVVLLALAWIFPRG
jgi:hypothetical protein